jgi:hypothetical protein
MKKVMLTIQTKSGRINITVEVEPEKTGEETIKKAQLKWLNEYINRDVYIRTYDNLTEAKAKAGVEIKGVII